jgi:twitching motility protein PilT
MGFPPPPAQTFAEQYAAPQPAAPFVPPTEYGAPTAVPKAVFDLGSSSPTPSMGGSHSAPAAPAYTPPPGFSAEPAFTAAPTYTPPPLAFTPEPAFTPPPAFTAEPAFTAAPPLTAEPAFTAPPAFAAEPSFSAPPASSPSTVSAPAAEPAQSRRDKKEEEVEWFDPSYDDEAAKVARSKADPDLLQALQEVVMLGASDLHVSSNSKPMIRIDGGLRPIEGSETWSSQKVRAAITSILSPLQLETFDKELELDLAYTISANARYRVNVYQQRGNVGAAFRLIPTGIKKLEELGLPDSISRFATLARGLVLVTGPTGSGKSTTLAALVDLVNRTRADHIVTVEDPIEFLHNNQKSLINQREVGADTHSFAAALKHVLRQDPDVILIGELRDLETISVALTAAETGHLVFATLHTQDAPQTIDRVIDVFPPHQQGQVRAQLAATLQGVVCQTLVKRAEGKGRAVVTEVLVTTPAVANLIREGKTYQIPSAMQAGRDLGMHTMDQALADLVNSGQITHQAARDKAHDAEGLDNLIHRADPTPGAFGVDYGDGRVA